MTIWVGNSTRQEMIIEVRVPEMGRSLAISISSGKQQELANLAPSQESAIIDHLAMYGGTSRKSLHGKTAGFQGIVYSTDKPINMDEFNYGFEEVMESAQNRSVTEAVNSALAADNLMTRGGERMALSTEVEMEEDRALNKGAKKKMSIKVDPKIDRSDKLLAA